MDGRSTHLSECRPGCQQQAQQTGSLIAALAGKLSTAAAAGDPNAREWGLDLKEIALAIRDEQSTTTELLQAIHALIDSHVAAAAPQPAYYPPPTEYSQQPQVGTGCGGGWQVYLRQNMPGYGAHAADGSPIKNWWPFLFY